jgi:LPS sulfotransferase NodH
MAYVKFVVLTSSRTGSTWLMDLLNHHPAVSAYGELFLGKPRTAPAVASLGDHPRFIETDWCARYPRAVAVFRYLNALYAEGRVTGFKLMYTQLRSYPEILAYFMMRRVRILHLVRANLLDVLISEELARLTGTSHVRAGEFGDAPKVTLDTATLFDRLNGRRRAARAARLLIALSACRSKQVSYEQLLDDPNEFSRICEFLSVSHVSTIPSELEKRGTGMHRMAISNYDEVRATLASSPYETMLN